ncbi:amino acid adenylation domain-containing protein [Paenibacillus sp. 1011MAR3C5]|uniref:non-ribosomal peptide synthetase n=1 Tax=Paenibacillus sp. 1011MAR3C5 TaxID=1675787 RepID=UPI000E6B7737|nr:non-ribosomal peptide synthetase [Paenibacillus sp. 1011MAR3C5]RJE89653.1 amino acid adenylation domain-containing protein [Paenibacillus sp. 1011MAR3C5]
MTEKRLDRANVEDMLGLTPTQEGLLFHYASGAHQEDYVQQLTVRFTGECRMDRLQAAWKEVIRRNEMLRTVFRYEKLERPVQIVLKQAQTPIKVVDLSAWPSAERELRVQEERECERRNMPDLETAPLRVTLCKLADSEGVMIVTWHHILFDGWSNGILLKELLQAYRVLSRGESSQELAGKTRFKEFVKWHQSRDRDAQRIYWQRELADWTERTAVPEPVADAADRAGEGPYRRKLPQAEAEAIMQFAQSREVTLAALLYGAWGLLLSRYSRTDDVVFGTTVSGRVPQIRGIEEMVGLFINTIPLRIQCGSDLSVDRYIRSINDGLKRREDYETTALVDIATYSGFNQREPLFDTIVVLENYPLDMKLMQDDLLKIERYEMTEKTHYGITVGIQAFEGIELEIAYDASRYSEAFIDRMAGHYMQLIRGMTGGTERSIGMIDMITEEERNEILHQFNREIAPAFTEPVHLLFERQACKTPGRVAVLSSGSKLTYGELNDKANRMAAELRRRGAAAGERVAILMERDDQLIAAMLGVLKSGAAYVPIDNAYAPERIGQILQDSGARLLLTAPDVAERYGYRDRCLNPMEISFQGDESRSKDDESPASSDPAYILYTSGSTGRPKGVVVEHGNLLAYVQAFQHEFKLTEEDGFLQQASCSFDQFVEEMYPVLLAGGRLVMADKLDVLDPLRLEKIIGDGGVTVVSCSPLLLNELNKQDGWEGVRIFISGGDVLKQEYYANLIKNAAVYNTYGPTEATVCATYHRCSCETRSFVPIGKPIWNYRVYVLNAAGHLQPIGLSGEICIGGEGVARGYLNRPELTAGSFVEDPFLAGGRLYKTGDIGKWLPDGSIQFLGRADEQIKIRGYRVEPGDVEHHLLAHPSVEDAIVLTVDDAYGQKALAAYIETTGETVPFIEELRDYLEARLPAYMVPSYFYVIPEVPRTVNGKTDKKALTGIARPLDRRPQDNLPLSEAEENIRRVWQEVLKLEDVGLHDHFFDLGGNSILLMQLHSKLEKEFGWGLGIVDLFTYSTIYKLAQWIESRNAIYDESMFGGYQTLPDRFFIRNPQASGHGSIRYHVQGELCRHVRSIAEEDNVTAVDVIASVFAYLFAVGSGRNAAVLQVLMVDAEQVSPWQVELDAISGFPDLFAAIGKLRDAGDSARYPISRAGEVAVMKDELEILPLIGRGEIHANAALLDKYEIVIAMEEEASANQLTVHMKFNDRRIRKEAVQEMASQSVDVLRQLTESRILS